MRHMLEKYGRKVTVNESETCAIIHALRRQSKQSPQSYFYTGMPEQKLLVGDIIKTDTDDYLVTRSDVETFHEETLYVWAILRRVGETALCMEGAI